MIYMNGEAISSNSVVNGGSSPHNYSTDEQVVGTWEAPDGTIKPLYEKTIYFDMHNAPSSGMVTGYRIPLSNYGIASDFCIIDKALMYNLLTPASGTTTSSTDNIRSQITSSPFSQTWNSWFTYDILTNEIIFKCVNSSGYSQAPEANKYFLIFVLKYTKITDTTTTAEVNE